MADVAGLKSTFQKTYQKTPRLFAAPGRVNLIGEHTDYNQGFVLPIAIDRLTYVAAAPNDGTRVRVHSLDLNVCADFDLTGPRDPENPHWLSYIEGVARVLREQNPKIKGADLLISSNVPIGSGLSSSAALEMSVGYAFLTLGDVKVDQLALALAGQKAEHDYAGAKVGLMDQLASVFGQKKHALLIDCRSFARTPIELKIGDMSIVVCDTHVKHELAASAYNERRAQCEMGVELLRKELPQIESLRDVSLSAFSQYADALPVVIRKRCRHVISENDRTLHAAEALRHSDIEEFGKLMQLSHESLRDDYEVSSPELDLMVELAMAVDGVAGARMTGGGFGGCTVNLVEKRVLEQFSSHIGKNYKKQTGTDASIYVVEAADGVSEIKE